MVAVNIRNNKTEKNKPLHSLLRNQMGETELPFKQKDKGVWWVFRESSYSELKLSLKRAKNPPPDTTSSIVNIK